MRFGSIPDRCCCCTKKGQQVTTAPWVDPIGETEKKKQMRAIPSNVDTLIRQTKTFWVGFLCKSSASDIIVFLVLVHALCQVVKRCAGLQRLIYCWLIESDSNVFSLFTQRNVCVLCHLAVVSHSRPRLAYILGHYGHAHGGESPVNGCMNYLWDDGDVIIDHEKCSSHPKTNSYRNNII